MGDHLILVHAGLGPNRETSHAGKKMWSIIFTELLVEVLSTRNKIQVDQLFLFLTISTNSPTILLLLLYDKATWKSCKGEFCLS
jgi:hypothetical protein